MRGIIAQDSPFIRQLKGATQPTKYLGRRRKTSGRRPGSSGDDRPHAVGLDEPAAPVFANLLFPCGSGGRSGCGRPHRPHDRRLWYVGDEDATIFARCHGAPIARTLTNADVRTYLILRVGHYTLIPPSFADTESWRKSDPPAPPAP